MLKRSQRFLSIYETSEAKEWATVAFGKIKENSVANEMNDVKYFNCLTNVPPAWS